MKLSKGAQQVVKDEADAQVREDDRQIAIGLEALRAKRAIDDAAANAKREPWPTEAEAKKGFWARVRDYLGGY